MNKLIFLVIFILCGMRSFSQIYVPKNPTVYGNREKRFKADSSIGFPSKDTLLSTSDISPQIFYRPIDSTFYGWSLDKGFFKIGSGNGTGIDNGSYHSMSTSLDSIYGILNRPNGTKDSFMIVADGFVNGVQTVTGTAVDNTDPKNPVINSSTLPYKVYTAILQDTGTSAHPPIPVVLENTLGCTVSISYSGVGWYTVTLSSPLMTNSTIVICQNPGYSPMTLLEHDPSDVSNFTLHVRRTDGTPVDGQCDGAFLEIRIY